MQRYVLPNGAHHLDFMWSHPDDPPDAVAARDFIVAAIDKFVAERLRRASAQEL